MILKESAEPFYHLKSILYHLEVPYSGRGPILQARYSEVALTKYVHTYN